MEHWQPWNANTKKLEEVVQGGTVTIPKRNLRHKARTKLRITVREINTRVFTKAEVNFFS